MTDLQKYVEKNSSILQNAANEGKKKAKEANTFSIATDENYKIVKALFASNMNDEARIEILKRLNF